MRCRHKALYFSDGGREIGCVDCPMRWKVRGEYDGAMLGIFDWRAHPEDLAPRQDGEDSMAFSTRVWAKMAKKSG